MKGRSWPHQTKRIVMVMLKTESSIPAWVPEGYRKLGWHAGFDVLIGPTTSMDFNVLYGFKGKRGKLIRLSKEQTGILFENKYFTMLRKRIKDSHDVAHEKSVAKTNNVDVES